MVCTLAAICWSLLRCCWESQSQSTQHGTCLFRLDTDGCWGCKFRKESNLLAVPLKYQDRSDNPLHGSQGSIGLIFRDSAVIETIIEGYLECCLQFGGMEKGILISYVLSASRSGTEDLNWFSTDKMDGTWMSGILSNFSLQIVNGISSIQFADEHPKLWDLGN